MNKWYAVDHDDAILKNWMAGIKQVTGHPDPSEYDHWDNIKLTPTTNSISVSYTHLTLPTILFV